MSQFNCLYLSFHSPSLHHTQLPGTGQRETQDGAKISMGLSAQTMLLPAETRA